MSGIHAETVVRLYAGDVLVAEVADAGLFSAVLASILPKRCALCYQVPAYACCRREHICMQEAGR